jgi:transposase
VQGKKIHQAKLFYDFSLEQAVPPDDFYRKLELAVDLAWVGPRVAHCYADIGRPSVDPEVIVKIELIAYLEGITSERALMRQIGDRLSLRRYLGYDLDEALPDHSTLSRARDLLGRDLFQAVFDYSVRLCQAAGMVGGLHVSGDRTLVKADASLDSLERRLVAYSPAEFLDRRYAEDPASDDQASQPAPLLSVTQRPDYPTLLPLAQATAPTHAPTEAEPGASPGEGATAAKSKGKEGTREPVLSNATHVSRSDPEATLVARPSLPPMLAYSAEVWSDARAGVITHADAFPGTSPEHTTALGALERQRHGLGLPLATMAYDKGGGQGRLYRQLAQFGIVAFVPHQKYVNASSGPGLFALGDFVYDAAGDVYQCPGGRALRAQPHLKVSWPWVSQVWQAKPSDCQPCPLRSQCTKAARYRTLQVNLYQPEYKAMDARLAGPGARLAAIARRTGPELRFAEGKRWQGLARAKYRGLHKFKGQVLLSATAQNIKKYIKWTWRKTKGAGRLSTTNPAQSLTFVLGLQQPLKLTPIPL